MQVFIPSLALGWIQRPLLFALSWFTGHRPFFCAPVIIVTVLGIALSALVLLTIAAQQRDAAWDIFAEQAQQSASLIEDRVARHIHSVSGIPALYGASNEVERAEFAEFARRTIASDPGLAALGFVPHIPAADRARFEAAARAEGLADFAIQERGGDGGLVPAAVREAFYPVFFVEPSAGREGFLGFDLGSDPRRLEVLQRARDTGQISVSGSLELLGGDTGIL